MLAEMATCLCVMREVRVLLYDNNCVFVRRVVKLGFMPRKMALFERRLAVSDCNRAGSDLLYVYEL